MGPGIGCALSLEVVEALRQLQHPEVCANAGKIVQCLLAIFQENHDFMWCRDVQIPLRGVDIPMLSCLGHHTYSLMIFHALAVF